MSTAKKFQIVISGPYVKKSYALYKLCVSAEYKHPFGSK